MWDQIRDNLRQVLTSPGQRRIVRVTLLLSLAAGGAVVLLVVAIGWGILLDWALTTVAGSAATTPRSTFDSVWMAALAFGPPLLTTALVVRRVLRALPAWAREMLGLASTP